MRKRSVLIGLAVVSSIGLALFVFTGNSDKPIGQTTDVPAQTEESVTEAGNPEPNPNISLIASGDMLPHDSINQQAETASGYDYLPYFENIRDLYANKDIVFCNQEAPSAGEAYGIAGYPSFNAPQKFSVDLHTLGCNMVNLANNHVADRGVDGINETISVWNTLDTLAVAGANTSAEQQNTVRYFDVKGVRFAFLAFTDLTNNTSIPAHSINMFSDALVSRLVGEANANADVVIVSAHWGVEYSPDVSQSQEAWANSLVQNGADIIIGTGPHVLQPVDRVARPDGGEALILYSLGNMLSTQLEIEQLIGVVADIEIDPSDLSSFAVSFTPTYMHYEWTAEQAAVEDLLARTNLKLYRLSQAMEPLSRSLFNTTVAAQKERVTSTLSARTAVTVLD